MCSHSFVALGIGAGFETLLRLTQLYRTFFLAASEKMLSLDNVTGGCGIPYYTTGSSLALGNKTITRAIVVMPDLGGNPSIEYCAVTEVLIYQTITYFLPPLSIFATSMCCSRSRCFQIHRLTTCGDSGQEVYVSVVLLD